MLLLCFRFQPVAQLLLVFLLLLYPRLLYMLLPGPLLLLLVPLLVPLPMLPDSRTPPYFCNSNS